MASNRMTQAIGALERAVTRLEQQVDNLGAVARHDTAPSIDAAAARAALRSLDELIDELKGEARG